MSRLIAAYPEHLAGVEGNELVWKDGTRMVIDDGRGAKPFETLLASPDLKDMFYAPYPVGGQAIPPAVNVDPGRVRHAAFFDKIYGDCRSGAVAANLVEIVWLPRKWGRRLQVTRLNGVAARLEAVSKVLDALPARFDPYLYPSAGTYNCRPIAGTDRVSAHGHGIAIDIALKHAHYWRWTKPDASGRYPYRNAIPMEIVEIFEAHGFIWGGKWYHYDSMHFEYRPEMFP
ncbi:MAG TPA: M15 family metallopeptidase [Hyphomicrobiaceae bacterium]|nr:M15 family metallopeptidase [Hyphomicrobiaceae bacterium]